MYTNDLVSNPSDWVNKDQSYSDTVKGEKTLNQPIFLIRHLFQERLVQNPFAKLLEGSLYFTFWEKGPRAWNWTKQLEGETR